MRSSSCTLNTDKSSIQVSLLRLETGNLYLEVAVRWCSSKKVFLKISQFLQEHNYVGVSFFKVAGPPDFQTFNKTRLQQRCFPMDIAKVLRVPLFKGHLR